MNFVTLICFHQTHAYAHYKPKHGKAVTSTSAPCKIATARLELSEVEMNTNQSALATEQ